MNYSRILALLLSGFSLGALSVIILAPHIYGESLLVWAVDSTLSQCNVPAERIPKLKYVISRSIILTSVDTNGCKELIKSNLRSGEDMFLSGQIKKVPLGDGGQELERKVRFFMSLNGIEEYRFGSGGQWAWSTIIIDSNNLEKVTDYMKSLSRERQ